MDSNGFYHRHRISCDMPMRRLDFFASQFCVCSASNPTGCPQSKIQTEEAANHRSGIIHCSFFSQWFPGDPLLDQYKQPREYRDE
jgi:hypothetical protein